MENKITELLRGFNDWQVKDINRLKDIRKKQEEESKLFWFLLSIIIVTVVCIGCYAN